MRSAETPESYKRAAAIRAGQDSNPDRTATRTGQQPGQDSNPDRTATRTGQSDDSAAVFDPRHNL